MDDSTLNSPGVIPIKSPLSKAMLMQSQEEIGGCQPLYSR